MEIDDQGAPEVPVAGMSNATPLILVPAAIVAQSHPCGHSVPIIRARRRRQRAHPYRNLFMAFLIALVPMSLLVAGVYYSVEVQRSAGFHLVCSILEDGSRTRSICHWERQASDIADRGAQ
jgi:hypothetical protein